MTPPILATLYSFYKVAIADGNELGKHKKKKILKEEFKPEIFRTFCCPCTVMPNSRDCHLETLPYSMPPALDAAIDAASIFARQCRAKKLLFLMRARK